MRRSKIEERAHGRHRRNEIRFPMRTRAQASERANRRHGAMERVKNAKNFFSKLRVPAAPRILIWSDRRMRAGRIDRGWEGGRGGEREIDKKKGPSAYSSAPRRAALETRTLRERPFYMNTSFRNWMQTQRVRIRACICVSRRSGRR